VLSGVDPNEFSKAPAGHHHGTSAPTCSQCACSSILLFPRLSQVSPPNLHQMAGPWSRRLDSHSLRLAHAALAEIPPTHGLHHPRKLEAPSGSCQHHFSAWIVPSPSSFVIYTANFLFLTCNRDQTRRPPWLISRRCSTFLATRRLVGPGHQRGPAPVFLELGSPRSSRLGARARACVCACACACVCAVRLHGYIP
jgi:hypothetical protein